MQFIEIFIGLTILVGIAKVMYPLVVAGFLQFSVLGDFAFADLFANDGVAEIIIGVILLLTVLAYLGIGKLTGRQSVR